MGADVDLNAFFDTLWDSTLFRAIAIVAVVVAVAALFPGRKRR